MRTTLRRAREMTGVTMADLAGRLGVSVPSVSTLELNDERGVAKVETVERALAALGLARFDVVLPADMLGAIVDRAQRLTDAVEWTMALEAQNLQPDAREAILRQLVMSQVAKAVATA